MVDPKWREFELLVARIEQWLGPRGAEVKSPDRMPDRVTGELREVDASIRFHVGSAPVLLIVECRDRADVQDVTWVEQIASKRDSVGAARAVAVSSRGFTKPARVKAAALGIELRTMSEITEDVATQWAHKVKITFTLIRWDVISLELRAEGVTPGGAPGGGFSPDVASAFRANPSDTQIGYERCSGKPLTIRAMIDHACSKVPGFTADLEVGKPPLRKTLTIGYPAGSFAFFTDKGECDLEEMKLTVDVWQTAQSTPVPKVVRYESGEGAILEVAQAALEVEPGRRLTLLYSQTPPADASDGTAVDGPITPHAPS